MKIIPALTLEDSETVIKEIKILMNIKHKHVISLIEAFVAEGHGSICIVMDLAEGKTSYSYVILAGNLNDNNQQLGVQL